MHAEPGSRLRMSASGNDADGVRVGLEIDQMEPPRPSVDPLKPSHNHATPYRQRQPQYLRGHTYHHT